ncbi:MAG: adaptor protein MecA [Acetatifactor sp.]|nr:adaptor protein MecA [Acetatifactor sp.]
MKIEKVNDNQIRCTLTREDLASRELKISELAYGTEKAKNLFRDMMRQANFEFGFEAEDIPLMIEAIPLNAECIVLIITKVEDPEELDTRFSRFAPSVTEDEELEEYAEAGADEVLDLFRRLQTEQNESAGTDAAHNAGQGTAALSRVFRMDSLQAVMSVSQLIASHFQGASTLYKEAASGKFFLLLTGTEETQSSFDRVCNIVSEYGTLQRSFSGTSGFLTEHCEALIRNTAVQSLGI